MKMHDYTLNERQQKAIDLRKEGMTFREIGITLGVSASYANQIYQKAAFRERRQNALSKVKR